jgi:hypothetical protein
MYLDLKTRY